MTTGIKWRAAARTAALAGIAWSGLTAARAEAGSNPEVSEPIVITGIAAPELFGTATVSVRLSRYSADWARARRPALRNPAMLRLVAPARGLGREEQVAYVQRAVHRQIRWMSDATEWGRHEYWASASETLAHGAGDIEDRAIVKMHALRALGFSPRDLVLTIGRDKVGGQIVILIVRAAKDRYLTLDDLGGPPVPMERREGFEPMLSFSGERSWLHGRRVRGRDPAAQVEHASGASGAGAVAPASSLSFAN